MVRECSGDGMGGWWNTAENLKYVFSILKKSNDLSQLLCWHSFTLYQWKDCCDSSGWCVLTCTMNSRRMMQDDFYYIDVYVCIYNAYIYIYISYIHPRKRIEGSRYLMVLQAIICADVFLGTFHDRVFGSLSHSVSAENHPLLPQPEMG